MLCPVCLNPVRTDEHGLVLRHPDSVGMDCRMSGQLGPVWTETSTRAAVSGRSGGICEFCMKMTGQEMHHRKSRGVGGRWHPANILHLCRRCHHFATEHPGWSHALGLIVRSGENPSTRPVQRENGVSFQPTDEVTMPVPKGRR